MITASGLVSTIAGTGSATTDNTAANGDGGPAASATFKNPMGLCMDNTYPYVMDFNSHKVRRVTLLMPAISTLAGTGPAGLADGIGSAASLNKPAYCAFNGTSSLIVTNFASGKIRVINTVTAQVTTLTGTISSVTGLWVDYSFNIYAVSSSQNAVYRRLNNESAFSLFVGKGAAPGGYVDAIGTNAMFSTPYSVCGNTVGELFVADRANHRIRKIVIAGGGVVSTLAGNGDAFDSGDGGDAMFASLYSPVDVKVDTNGRFYVVEELGNTVR